MVVYKGCSTLSPRMAGFNDVSDLQRSETRPLINTIALQVVAIFIAEFHTTKGRHHTTGGLSER